MLKRLMVGLLLGVIVGGLVAAGLIRGLGVVTFGSGAILAYLAAVVTGALVGLVAGKPVWAKGAWIEVGLKAFFGSLLAAGVMFVLRRWVDISVNLESLGAGVGALGELPATSLPIIATLLSVFYEIDNTDSGEGAKEEDGKSPKRIAAGADGKRVADDTTEGDDEEEAAAPAKKRAAK